MYKYKTIREAVAKASEEVIGQTPADAAEICKSYGLQYRWISRDGDHSMLTSDCQMDRIGFVINKGIVTEVRNG